ncbi:MAG: acyl-CoA dehydrogenase family protein, partial [Anaerolineales bacterium]|nr:acyl-CoA dehydrogenase family protein [Anaerolineales bacterium]
MNLQLTDEQRMIVEMVRTFVEKELQPYEEEVEREDGVRPELQRQIRDKALQFGLYAANMPEELGGAGLDTVSLALME